MTLNSVVLFLLASGTDMNNACFQQGGTTDLTLVMMYFRFYATLLGSRFCEDEGSRIPRNVGILPYHH